MRTAPSLLAPQYLLSTLGACALVALAAFEAMAVITVMPLISAALDGENLYALAFAGPLATSVLGMVGGGRTADKFGPPKPLLAAVALFAVGLIVCSLAPSMEVFLAGRLLQGIGGGAITVVLYALVGRVYPPALHPKMFASFATAWVVPALVGPYIAGQLTNWLSWHVVFYGVAILVIPALAAMVPALKHVSAVHKNATQPNEPAADKLPLPHMLAWGALAGAGILALNVLGQIGGVWGPVLALASVVTTLFAAWHLVPRGSLRARPGLPSVLATRALVAAGFFGAEVYVPYALMSVHGFSPATGGLAITCAAVSWAIGSDVQGRFERHLPHTRIMRWGTIWIAGVVVAETLALALGAPSWAVIAIWPLGSFAMGMIFPRLSTLTLAYSAPGSEGSNSSALAIAEALACSIALAGAGLVFNSLAALNGTFSGADAAHATEVVALPSFVFAGVFGLALVWAVGAIFVARRVRVPE